ncbi:MAG TPA: extracellular solute-binding protein [Chloroflexota bacterium]|nr:extracellular solute-binding protein [Chloroflexota bacterium]
MDRASFRRRRMLAGTALLGGAALAACGPVASGPGQTQSKGPVTIKLSMWDYNPQIVRQNLDRFQQENPGITVEGPETGACCDVYRTRMNTAFLAGERLDAMYMRDEDAAEWAEAKWIRELDKFPGAKELTKDEYPFVTEQTNYRGKKYGTIYYIGGAVSVYNMEHLKQAGFAKPPATFDELRNQAAQIKRQRINGVEFPLHFVPSEGHAADLYLATGKKMFDDDLQPIFGKDAQYKEVMDKLYQAASGDRIYGVDSTIQFPFDNGKSTFAWTSFYDLKRLNGKAEATGSQSGGLTSGGAAAGQLMNYVNPGLMSGRTGANFICRQYAVSNKTPHPDESWKLIYFLGGKDSAGKYSVAKRWWVEQGLNFGYKSMADDPEIKKFSEGWGDLEAYNRVATNASPRPGVKAPWSALWRTEYAKAVTEMMAGTLTTKDGIERGVQIWNQMRGDFERNNPTFGKK